jgi:adenosylcobinamide-GDP ribazoletransferase
MAAAIAAFASALWLGRLFVRRLGGYTGDCLGAVQQLAEALIYVAILATLGHGAWGQ